MIEIYSKKEEGLLLHQVITPADLPKIGRLDFTPETEFLQGAIMRLPQKTFRAHRHIECIRDSNMTQEAWVIVGGRIIATFYDLDDSHLKEVELRPGDCCITFRGGHNFEVLDEGTLAYEFKTGPYLGREADKVWLDEV